MSPKKTENPVPESDKDAVSAPKPVRRRRTKAETAEAAAAGDAPKAPAKPRRSTKKSTSSEAAPAKPKTRTARKPKTEAAASPAAESAKAEKAPAKPRSTKLRTRTRKPKTPRAAPDAAAQLDLTLVSPEAAAAPESNPAAEIRTAPAPEQTEPVRTAEIKETPAAAEPVTEPAEKTEKAVEPVAPAEVTEVVPAAVKAEAVEAKESEAVAPVAPASVTAPAGKTEKAAELVAPAAVVEEAPAAVKAEAVQAPESEAVAPVAAASETAPADNAEKAAESSAPAAVAEDAPAPAKTESVSAPETKESAIDRNKPETTAADKAQTVSEPAACAAQPAPESKAAAAAADDPKPASSEEAARGQAAPESRESADEKAEKAEADKPLLPQPFRSRKVVAGVLVVVAFLCYWLFHWWYFDRALDFPEGAASVDVTVPAGASGREIARRVEDSGVGVSADTLIGFLRVQGSSVAIHAGRYRFEAGMSLADVIEKLRSGEVEKFSFRISDGQPIWDLRRSVTALPDIAVKTKGMTDDELRRAIGVAEPHLEGVFAPETYNFKTGITDMDVYRAAYREQMRILNKEWEARSAAAMVKTKYEALILASVIEKETSVHTDRALVSSVFNNRLKKRMPLQTDPTIIYGIGAEFNGNLTRRDMQRPGPYNTYLNYGLPPTPISMPSAASIHAALNPADTKYLYFVARGDGTTYFSRTLAEHNRAVEKYQKAPARKARALRRQQDNKR